MNRNRPVGCKLVAALVGALLVAPTFGADEGDGPDVSVRLVSERAALVAGETARLGLVFDIEPEWHLYWRNNGDTGMPISVDWRVPEAVEAGDLQWPAPSRYAHDGMVDYIYEDRVTLILPIRVDERAAGETLSIGAEAQWLVCREACLPGDAKAKITLPVLGEAAEPPPKTSAARFIEHAERRLPQRWRPEDGSGVSAAWRGRTLTLRAEGADELIFYPLAPSEAPPSDPASTGRATGRTLTIEYDARLDDAETISGVLEARRGDKTTIHFIELSRRQTETRGG